MNSATGCVFPSAIIGSILLSFFAFTITSGMALPPVSIQTKENPSQVHEIQDEASSNNSNSPPETLTLEQTKTQDAANEETADCQVSKKYPSKIRQWCETITHFAKKNELDPDLVAALIWQESGGNPSAYSHSGAVGLMQVMPRDGIAASFMCNSGPCFFNRPSIQQLQDASFNVQYGTKMLSGLVKKHGDIREALKNYGPMDVGYYYADIVLGIYSKNKD